MSFDILHVAARDASRRGMRIATEFETLRAAAVVAGIGWAIVFVVIGLTCQLQLYGDGSIFSYAVAARDAWAFHFHNISGRVFVYLFSVLPAESYVALTGDGRGGIELYGLLFFVQPALSLALTYVVDKSQGRIIFVFACASTACLCPLVFGFPTEMWAAHALFWPALALCHYARNGAAATAAIAALLAALLLSHAGALIFAAVILATLWLRGADDSAFPRVAWSLAGAFVVLMFIRARVPPDDYFAPVLARAAWHVFDPNICIGRMVVLLTATLTGYGVVFASLRRRLPDKAHILAALAVAAALAVYWIYAYNPVHAERRYYMRTMLVVLTPAFGMIATLLALQSGALLRRKVPLVQPVLSLLAAPVAARAALGALVLVTLVHSVETTKFVHAWAGYKAAVRSLAMGPFTDPGLGNNDFVSSKRIDPVLNRLSWFSTTPYLSVLLAPGFSPQRLVIDPAGNYFWLSCATATANAAASNGIPSHSRDLIRVYSCLHRN